MRDPISKKLLRGSIGRTRPSSHIMRNSMGSFYLTTTALSQPFGLTPLAWLAIASATTYRSPWRALQNIMVLSLKASLTDFLTGGALRILMSRRGGYWPVADAM